MRKNAVALALPYGERGLRQEHRETWWLLIGGVHLLVCSPQNSGSQETHLSRIHTLKLIFAVVWSNLLAHTHAHSCRPPQTTRLMEFWLVFVVIAPRSPSNTPPESYSASHSMVLWKITELAYGRQGPGPNRRAAITNGKALGSSVFSHMRRRPQSHPHYPSAGGNFNWNEQSTHQLVLVLTTRSHKFVASWPAFHKNRKIQRCLNK